MKTTQLVCQCLSVTFPVRISRFLYMLAHLTRLAVSRVDGLHRQMSRQFGDGYIYIYKYKYIYIDFKKIQLDKKSKGLLPMQFLVHLGPQVVHQHTFPEFCTDCRENHGNPHHGTDSTVELVWYFKGKMVRFFSRSYSVKKKQHPYHL